MLRFVFSMILALGLFSFAGAKESFTDHLAPEFEEMNGLAALTAIDPVVRNAVLKQCSKFWDYSYPDLVFAYEKGDLTMVEAYYGADIAYDVTFDGNFLCVLGSDL